MNRYFIFYPILRDPSCLATAEVTSQIAQNQFQSFLVALILPFFLFITDIYTLPLMRMLRMAESNYVEVF